MSGKDDEISGREFREMDLEYYRSDRVSEEEVLSDLKETYLNHGTVSPEEYDEHGSFSKSTVRRRFGDYPSALESLGLPAKRDIQGVLDELEDIKREKGELSEGIYEEEGFFRPESIPAALGMDWEEIDEKIEQSI